MRRHLVGIVSLLLLLGATVAWFSTAAGQYAELEAMAWRVGAFLAVCWLAYPDVDRLPGWLLAALPIFVVAIAPMALAQFTAACADSTLVVLERQDLALVREAARTGLLLTGIVAAYLLKWPPRRAIFLFGATGTLAYTLYGFITWHAIRQHRGAAP